MTYNAVNVGIYTVTLRIGHLWILGLSSCGHWHLQRQVASYSVVGVIPYEGLEQWFGMTMTWILRHVLPSQGSIVHTHDMEDNMVMTPTMKLNSAAVQIMFGCQCHTNRVIGRAHMPIHLCV